MEAMQMLGGNGYINGTCPSPPLGHLLTVACALQNILPAASSAMRACTRWARARKKLGECSSGGSSTRSSSGSRLEKCIYILISSHFLVCFYLTLHV